ncbi:hypothetical protein [Gordonia sp. N1V]|uniref:hypothetical protein n=1 Tax=Gordonia sp. N1V TaxID=3034163 RepID=UPI0023E10CD4|nr:hypothetical protein [Gordonia sp. N1V]MDF3285348.1 hypothetical protein [Gordonia sp. N1V]
MRDTDVADTDTAEEQADTEQANTAPADTEQTNAAPDDRTPADTESPHGATESDEKVAEADQPPGRRASLTARLRSRSFVVSMIVAVILALAVATGVFGWQAHQRGDELDALRAQSADEAHARQLASDYAVAAARIDYRNFDPWFAALRSHVNQPLAQQFQTSEPALRDLLGQLQWVSTGTLVGSDIATHNDGTYHVQVFLDVTTSNVQSPDGVKTTALYPITVDGKNWQITDISGGISPLPGK